MRLWILDCGLKKCVGAVFIPKSPIRNQNTRRWIRTITNAINNRGLYRLSYTGMNIEPPGFEPGAFGIKVRRSTDLNYGSVAVRTFSRQGSNL